MTKEDFDSVNLFKEWLLIEEGISERMLAGIKWMQENDNDAIIIGAIAVVNYLSTSRPLTPDIDFLCTNIEKVKGKLNKKRIAYSSLYNKIGISVEKFNMDILDPDEGNKKLNSFALSNYTIVKIGGMGVRI